MGKPETAGDTVLSVRDLQVTFTTEEGALRAVDGVSFDLRRGRILSIVGESGCGKSVTAYSILRLIQSPGKITGGSILFRGKQGRGIDITRLKEKDDLLYDIRGGHISMIFQEPMTAMSPVHSIGNQLVEAIRLHQPLTKKDAENKAVEMLGKVGIPGPEKRISQFPHELSGGMRQRAVIAMALVCRPEILIADEPTTALDVTIQAQILELIKDMQKELGTSVIFITHDLGVVAQISDDVAVMYLGRIVERAPIRPLMKNPRHPYTMSLLESLPNLTTEKARLPVIKGSVPSLTAIPSGCPFYPRCPHYKPGLCDVGAPPDMVTIGDERAAACLRLDDIHGSVTA